MPAFKVVNVFDVSQTDGKPLPTIGVNELTGDVRSNEMFFERPEKSLPGADRFRTDRRRSQGIFSYG